MSMAVAAAVAASTGPGTLAHGDDLTRIRAIDAETARRLRSLGIARFVDIARWSESDIVRMSQSLGFAGRIESENWIEQARILVSGGQPQPASRAAGATSTVAAAAQEIRLHRIVGIDPATEKRLIDNGVTGVAEIARWMSSDIERIETLLGQPGRVGLENWIAQARVLLRGGSNVTELRPAAEARPAPVQQAPEAKPVPSPAASAAAAPKPVPLDSPQPQGGGPRTEFAGLRSVRSEALRREPLRASASVAGQSDDLKRIRGVGVLIEKKLKSLGITSYEQIANWTRADIDRINGILDFKGRIERENWVEQARILTSGGFTEFSRRADKGEIETSRNRA
jgi:predicted flap endonuclease-1-like 5' DNA nuclease